mmetsp:Transcript_11363/g.20068  ORF Transcript_11363/g.20068 Transcript_11363/m.20068 type:complete len:238 (+) Transcript_11363:2408-3121(+)
MSLNVLFSAVLFLCRVNTSFRRSLFNCLTRFWYWASSIAKSFSPSGKSHFNVRSPLSSSWFSSPLKSASSSESSSEELSMSSCTAPVDTTSAMVTAISARSAILYRRAAVPVLPRLSCLAKNYHPILKDTPCEVPAPLSATARSLLATIGKRTRNTHPASTVSSPSARNCSCTVRASSPCWQLLAKIDAAKSYREGPQVLGVEVRKVFKQFPSGENDLHVVEGACNYNNYNNNKEEE